MFPFPEIKHGPGKIKGSPASSRSIIPGALFVSKVG